MFDFIISSAHAQASAGAPGQSPLVSFIPFILIFFVMYFLMIRPQKKRLQEEQTFLSKLTKGDEVFLKSGIIGKITAIAEKVVTLEVEDGSKFKVLKSQVAGAASSIYTTTEEKK